MSDYISKVQEHFNQASVAYGEDNVWATMLYGSQNYDMATETSDVDVKTMLFPSVKDVVLSKKMVNAVLVHPDGSLNGLKDYRSTFGLYLKGNVRFLETLYTDYYVVNPKYADFFNDLRRHRELIANSLPRRLMHSAAGMAEQKYKAFDHPFPSKAEVLAKYAYDPKQLQHLARLNMFMYKFMRTSSYRASLHMDRDVRNYILSLKTNPIKVEEARNLAEETMKDINKMVQSVDEGALPEENNRAAAVEYLESLALDLFKARYEVKES